jgi:integrase
MPAHPFNKILKILSTDYLPIGGVNLRTVQTLLGHKDLGMTMRYSHLSPEHLREAVQNLEKSLNLKEGISESLGQQSIP